MGVCAGPELPCSHTCSSLLHAQCAREHGSKPKTPPSEGSLQSSSCSEPQCSVPACSHLQAPRGHTTALMLLKRAEHSHTTGHSPLPCPLPGTRFPQGARALLSDPQSVFLPASTSSSPFPMARVLPDGVSPER